MSSPRLRVVPEEVARIIPPKIADLIATQGLPLVRKLALKHGSANDVGLDASECLSIGQSVMAEVAPDYDEEHDARFTTYIFPFVDGAMKDEIRRRRRVQKVHRRIARELEREGRHFAATQSDRFDVLHNAPETSLALLDDNMSQLAARLAGTAVVTASDLLQRGTDEGVREARRDALAVRTIHEAIPMMEPKLQKLWQMHYEERLTLAQYAKAMGISLATAKLYHKQFKDRLREILKENGCG